METTGDTVKENDEIGTSEKDGVETIVDTVMEDDKMGTNENDVVESIVAGRISPNLYYVPSATQNFCHFSF